MMIVVMTRLSSRMILVLAFSLSCYYHTCNGWMNPIPTTTDHFRYTMTTRTRFMKQHNLFSIYNNNIINSSYENTKRKSPKVLRLYDQENDNNNDDINKNKNDLDDTVNRSSSSSNNNNKNQQFQNNRDRQSIELNELHTQLRDAVAKEDYIEAGRISDLVLVRMTQNHKNHDINDTMNDTGNVLSADEKRALRKRMSWKGLGAAPWLIDRLDSLQYTFPTTIQMNSLEAVNTILKENDDNNNNNNNDDKNNNNNDLLLTLEERTTKKEEMEDPFDMGIVISGTTGSGKTLAYAVPLLSILSESLFMRQRIRISDEEAIGNTMGDLVDRISVVTSPQINSRSRRSGTSGTIAIGASLGRSGNDVTKALALIIVPTRELGVQTSLLLYQLIGGNIKKSAVEFNSQTSKLNMFRYKGPKGIRIGCVLDDEEASYGLKLQTDIAITTPQYVTKLLSDGDIDPSMVRVIVYDEADLALERTKPNDLLKLFASSKSKSGDTNNNQKRIYSRLTFLVGASVTEALGKLAVRSRILPPGRSYIATATKVAPLEIEPTPQPPTQQEQQQQGEQVNYTLNSDNTMQQREPNSMTTIVGTQSASLKDLNLCLYPGLIHQRVVVRNETGLLVLTRLLRKELQEYEEKMKQTKEDDTIIQRPRVVVFFPDEQQAKAAIEPLRDALWNEHKLCVLLPTIGFNPLTMMEQFKNNETSVMLATPNSVRGLDFPALTHVYTLYLPWNDPREYVHLAGRVGRVGQLGVTSGVGGHVISVLKEEDAKRMDDLASFLGFNFTDLIPPENDIRIRLNEDGEIFDDDDDDENESDMKKEDEKIMIEKMRRLLEDTISLLNIQENNNNNDNDDNDNTTLGGTNVDIMDSLNKVEEELDNDGNSIPFQ